MINLAMDTAGSACSACLYDSSNDHVLAEISEEIGRGHAERLMAVISDVLAKARISYHDIGKIVTTIGPGSFTGIRVGVATARGFGIGLGIPVVGVSNLEASLQDASESGPHPTGTPMIALLSAGRNQIYTQATFTTDLGEADAPFLTSLDELAEILNGSDAPNNGLVLCGNMADELAGLLEQETTIAGSASSPPISVIAHIGAAREEGDQRPEPLYLRKPDAKPQEGFAVQRR